jgi:hypothetical protein
VYVPLVIRLAKGGVNRTQWEVYIALSLFTPVVPRAKNPLKICVEDAPNLVQTLSVSYYKIRSATKLDNLLCTPISVSVEETYNNKKIKRSLLQAVEAHRGARG